MTTTRKTGTIRAGRDLAAYASEIAFAAADSARTGGSHVDFGYYWTMPGQPHPRYRVSWIPATGELYAVRQQGRARRVELLAVGLRSRVQVDRAMGGWTEHVDDAGSLAWLDRRLDEVGL